jgi:hypothetical protein
VIEAQRFVDIRGHAELKIYCRNRGRRPRNESSAIIANNSSATHTNGGGSWGAEKSCLFRNINIFQGLDLQRRSALEGPLVAQVPRAQRL